MSTASPTGFGLREYVQTIGQVLDRRPSNRIIIREVSKATKELCRSDLWLEERYRIGEPDRYTRHLLHKDPQNRFIVLSLVWQPGQVTPIHDHACWGVMGLVDNTLEEICYERLDDGSRPDHCELEQTRGTDVSKGGVAYLLPPYEEIHRIGNTSDKPTISLHVYGRDLDEINVFDPVTGKVSPMRIKYYSPEMGDQPFII
ncbi:MAG: cysteine dioxygenase family protein [Planctomycetes bacterium]|nr:cysteine dioxygenase family protein [Planctomycetota bacterium]